MTSFSAAVLARNPGAFFENNETSGGVAVDSSTSATNGTYQGTPLLGQASLLTDGTKKSWIPNNVNSWLRLGAGAWMNPATGGISVLQMFTLSALPPTLGCLFARDDSSGAGRNWALFVTAAGGLRFLGSTTTVTNVDQSSSGLTLVTGKRYCVMMVWEYALTNVKIYLRPEDGSASVPFTVTGFTGVAIGDTLRPYTVGALDERADLAWQHRGNLQASALFATPLSSADFTAISDAAFSAGSSEPNALMGALWP